MGQMYFLAVHHIILVNLIFLSNLGYTFDGRWQTYDNFSGLEERAIEEIRELSPSEIQQVNDLMAEAMKESPNTTRKLFFIAIVLWTVCFSEIHSEG